MRIKKGHTSGRYDRSKASLKALVEKLITRHKRNVISLTEVSREGREEALRELCREYGWGVVTGDKGGMDDCAIMWDEEDFTHIASGTHVLSGYTYDAKGGGVVYAAWAVIQDASRQRLLEIAAHMASGVDRKGGLNGAVQRVRKWRKDSRALKALWNELADKYDVDAIDVTCDWNVNIRMIFYRLLFKRKYPGMTLALPPRKNLPEVGTLGNRIIDFSFIRGTIRRVPGTYHILARDDASDHRPFIQEYEL